MERLTRLLTVIALCTVFVGCSSPYAECPRSLEHVCIKVVNRNDQIISTLILSHERGKESFGPIEANGQASTSFLSPGENTYGLTAILANGDTIRSRENYVEGGNRVTEVLSSTEFQSTMEDY